VATAALWGFVTGSTGIYVEVDALPGSGESLPTPHLKIGTSSQASPPIKQSAIEAHGLITGLLNGETPPSHVPETSDGVARVVVPLRLVGSVLLHGPIGVGKRHTARNAASASRSRVFRLSLSEMATDPYEAVDRLLLQAEAAAASSRVGGVCIMLDCLEAFFPNDAHEDDMAAVSRLTAWIRRTEAPNPTGRYHAGICVVGVTTRPEAVNPMLAEAFEDEVFYMTFYYVIDTCSAEESEKSLTFYYVIT